MTLRVKLEIVPHGDEEAVYEIGRLDIFNMGHIDIGICEYGVIEVAPERGEAGLHRHTLYHPRKDGAWALVKKAIEDLEIK